jgi:hypothetical protein
MVARSETGQIIAQVEFTETVERDEVTMRLTYHFVDGSMDDETTTYRQQGTFRLIRNRHIQKGPFFAKPVDFTVEAAPGTATTRTADNNGKIRVESEHFDLPDDLANGFVGTLLLNVPPNTTPFRVGILAPVFGGRLIRSNRFTGQDRPLRRRCFASIRSWVASWAGLRSCSACSRKMSWCGYWRGSSLRW